MDSKDKKMFSKLLIATAEVFDKDLSNPVISLYFKSLKRFTINQVKRAMEKIVLSCKFFPKPVEIIEMIPGGPGNLADRAQIQADIVVDAIKTIGAYQSVRFADPVTNAVIGKCFGGWIQICDETLEKNLKWFRKDFVEYYQSYFRLGIESYDKHLGLIESNNINKGYLGYIPKLIEIGESVLQIERKI